MYDEDSIADFMSAQFRTACVDGEKGKFRQVFRYSGQLKTQRQKKMLLDNFKDAVVEAALEGTTPPVLLAQTVAFATGTDGLQVRCRYPLSINCGDGQRRAMQLQGSSNTKIRRWQPLHCRYCGSTWILKQQYQY
jgi:hypothetical protein